MSIRPIHQLAPTLGPVLDRAGAVLVADGPRHVATNYGSAAAELAACVGAVGLADRSELTKLTLTGPAEAIDQLTLRVAGERVAPGGALSTGGAWWCAADPGRLVVICEPEVGGRLLEQLRRRVSRDPAVALRDRSGDWAGLAIVGRRASAVLGALGVYGPAGDPRACKPVTACAIGGSGALWLLESDHQALAVLPEHYAAAAWHEIEQAGRPFGLCPVGREAIQRYALVLRGRRPL